jgi:hypothetical protein
MWHHWAKVGVKKRLLGLLEPGWLFLLEVPREVRGRKGGLSGAASRWLFGQRRGAGPGSGSAALFLPPATEADANFIACWAWAQHFMLLSWQGKPEWLAVTLAGVATFLFEQPEASRQSEC